MKAALFLPGNPRERVSTTVSNHELGETYKAYRTTQPHGIKEDQSAVSNQRRA